jgi:CBS domain containing-hemolysin-like protein
MRGAVRLDDAGNAFGRSLEHPKVTTVSGLVLALLGRPARVGDIVVWNRARIEVTAVAGRGVQEAAITPVTGAAGIDSRSNTSQK